jgi:hypothetical protein
MLFPTGDFSANHSANPMVRHHGKGPQGKTCRTCRHAVSVNRGTVRDYWKCTRRGLSRSSATDHRLKWDACRLYEEEP